MEKQILHKPISTIVLFGLVLGVAAIMTAITSISGYRSGWWRHPDAFLIFEWATYIAIVVLIILVYGLFKVRRQGGLRGLLPGIIGIVLSLPIVAATALFEYSARIYPAINDISTDTQDAPSFWDVPIPMEYPGAAVAKLQHAAYPDITPLILPISQQQTFKLALTVVTGKGWEVIAKDPVEGRIEAVDSSLLFGFKDEVVLRIAASDKGTIVDIRSRSRIGRIDRGANAKRIRDYLETLRESVAMMHKS